jgi:hypothetical protein
VSQVIDGANVGFFVPANIAGDKHLNIVLAKVDKCVPFQAPIQTL